MMTITHIFEGLRMFRRRILVAIKGTRKYEGNAKQICEKVLESCWNKNYLQTSSGHYTEFYARDFGWCAKYLKELGKDEWIKKTIDYALSKYKKEGIKTAITPDGKPFNFPNYYCIDAVSYMFHALRILGDKELIKKHGKFLQKEIYNFEKEVIDKKTGMVRTDTYFSSMKDCMLRVSSCYDNVMVEFLNMELQKLGMFNNPFVKYDLKKKIKKTFWTGKYFKNDTKEDIAITGDSNVIPFWTGVFTDKKMLKIVIESISMKGLDKPFPLKYSIDTKNEKVLRLVDFLTKGWERNSVWTMMGMMYIDVVSKIDRPKALEYLNKYTTEVEKYKSFNEIYNSKGKPYKTFFYTSDESMCWSSIYLAISKKLKP